MRVLALCLCLVACGSERGLHYVRTAVNAPGVARVALESYSDETLELWIANDGDEPLKFEPSGVRIRDGSEVARCTGTDEVIAKRTQLSARVRCDLSVFAPGALLTVSVDEGLETAAGPVSIRPLLLRVAHAP